MDILSFKIFHVPLHHNNHLSLTRKCENAISVFKE